MTRNNTNYLGNQNAAKYKTPEEFQKVIDNYFAKCDEEHRPYTMSGLALALGLDRSTLVRYGEKDLFANLVKKAKLKVETMLEENLYRTGNNSGIIFNLKNNYGWRDQIEIADNDKLNKVEELLSKLNDEANK
ncbi:hypothetical protein IKN40_04435 [bacterium]|nr:hypothetical protein [bacterium]